MGTNDMRKSCVKCKKMVKSTETVLVCGLWCGKTFHNDCVGLTHSETRVVTCSNERIKFHCETCRRRLGVELVGEQETQEPNKLQNCVNNCLLELIQKILKLTNELSNDNSVINKKLDTVISSNTRLEEYILQSPKCVEKRREQVIDNNVEYVESFSAKRKAEISEENDTNADNTSVNSASMPQQTDVNSSSLHSASHIPRQLSDIQEPRVAEECSSHMWEESCRQNNLQDPPSTIKEEFSSSEDFLECGTFSIEKIEDDVDGEPGRDDMFEEHIPSEDILVRSVCSIAEAEYEGDEEKAAIEIKEEEFSSSEDFLECGTFSIEKIEDDVDGEPGRDDMFEELRYEVKPASTDNEVERNIAIHLDDLRNKNDRSHLITKDVQTVTKRHRIQCTTNQEVSSGNNMTFKQKTTLNLHSCSHCNKTFALKSSLRWHWRLHTDERPYSCSICSMTFTRISNLQQHSRVHSGDRTFSCSVCNKTFTKKPSLIKHLRVHSGERPFSCSVCNKTFSHIGKMKRHLRIHTGKSIEPMLIGPIHA